MMVLKYHVQKLMHVAIHEQKINGIKAVILKDVMGRTLLDGTDQFRPDCAAFLGSMRCPLQGAVC